MKEKFFLICIGLLAGALLTAASYPLLKRLALQTPEGASFESVEDFQRAMLARDDRDVQADRSVSLRSIITPHPDDRIMYDLLPNLDVKFQGVPLQTNSCGFRGPERSVEKPENVYRIVLLGDSFTFGWGVKQHESFAQVLEDVLNKVFQGTPQVEVLNLGVPGYSTFQEVALFEEKGLDFDPDAVLVYFIDNDFGLPFFIKNIHKTGGIVTGTSFAKLSWKKIDPLIDEQNKQLMRWLDPNKALRRIADLAVERGMKFFIAINPRPDWVKDWKRLWLLKTRRDDVENVRLRPGFLDLIEKREINLKDLSLPTDPHPSALKHQLLGELLAAALMPAVDTVALQLTASKQ